MNKKALSSILILLLLTSTMIFAFFSTMETAMADNQSSDSNGNPNSWLMFHSDLSHTGNSTSTAPITGAPLWRYPTGNQIISSPAVATGILYIGLTNGNVSALNAANGAYIWNYTTGNAVYSSPAVAGGSVYIGSLDGNVYALNAATGSKMWNYSTGNQVWSSPSVANGVVYVGSDSGYVYALNATTGSLLWNYATGPISLSSPAIANGIMYLGSTNGNVYALNASNGAHVWNYAAGTQVWSSPAVAGSVVYVGSYDGNVLALNAATGGKLWNYSTGSYVLSSPAVVSNVVYIGSYDGNVYALNSATGSKLWNYSTASYVLSSPAVANGQVFVGAANGNMYALNAATGSKTWTYPTYNGVASSPAIANGIMYVGSYDGYVYAFGSLGQTSTSTSVSCSPNPALAGSTITCVATVSGSNPIGSVSWTSNSSTGIFSSSTTTVTSGNSTTTYTDNTPGKVTITATYNGDTNNGPSNGIATLTLNGFLVSGYVLTPNGTPVTNVYFELYNNTWSNYAYTDMSGHYSVVAPAGTFTIYVNAPSGGNLLSYQGSVVVSGNQVMNITLQSGFVVSGYVLTPRGAAVASASVEFYNSSWSTSGYTSSLGYYSLGVTAGTYSVYCGPPSGTNLLNYQVSGVVVSGNMVYNITLQTGLVVSGYVQTPTGAAVANVYVNFNGPSYSGGTTNSSGYYSAVLQAGTYSVSVSAPSGTNLINYQASNVVVSSNMVYNITLQTGVIVSGYLLTPSGMGVANTYIDIYNDTWNTNGYTSSSGYYSVAVAPGTYSFYVNAPSGTNLLNYQAYNVVVSGNMVYNMTLPTGLIVSGYVLAPSGAVIANAYVSFNNGTWTNSANANSAGYYSVAVYAGTYSVSVSSLPTNINVVTYQALGVMVSGNMAWNITLQSSIVPSNSWPMYHGGLSHSGYSSSLAPTTNQTLWSYNAGGAVSSSPTVANGIVYAGSMNNTMFALNATSGQLIWSYVPGGNVSSAPAVANGMVFFGTQNGNFFALNAATGNKMWNYSTTGSLSSSAVANGVVFFGSSNGNMYALNTFTGQLMWIQTIGGFMISSPAVDGGYVYVASTNGNIYQLNVLTGQTGWTWSSGGIVTSSPAVVAGMVYIGSSNGLVTSYDMFFSSWSYNTTGAVTSSPAVADGVVYVGSMSGSFYAFDATTGSKLWSTVVGPVSVSSPAVANGIVYIGSTTNEVYALNASTGQPIWSYTTGGAVTSSPAVANGVVYVGSGDGYLYAFGSVLSAQPSPALSASTVTQGQNSLLTATAVTSGYSPYTYQWFSEAPGTSTYALINGASSASYNFVTSTSTAPGTWSFIIQVTDATGTQMNSTAAQVIVNTPQPTPTPTPTPPPTPAPTTGPTSAPIATPTNHPTTAPTAVPNVTQSPSPSPSSSPTPTIPEFSNIAIILAMIAMLCAVALASKKSTITRSDS